MTIQAKGILGFIPTPSANEEGSQTSLTHSETTTHSPMNSSQLKQAHQGLKRLENFKKADEEWNANVTGELGGHWDVARATNFQSKNPVLNEALCVVNNTVGWGAMLVNAVNTAGGQALFDAPAMIENYSVENGGPSFDELAISAQAATPAMPIDDAAVLTVGKLCNLSRQVQRFQKLRKLNLDKLKVSDKVIDLIDMGMSREAYFDAKQLQEKFDQAINFGVKGNYSLANASKFKEALTQHLNNPQVVPIRGTYRGTQPVLHFYHPETKLNVILDKQSNFISGWELSVDQNRYLLERGNVQ